MRNGFFALSLGIGAMLLATNHAFAQGGNCAQRDQVLERLQSHYGETRRSVALGGDNIVVETFASAETGTWTITATLPNGMTCLVASGQAYEPITEPLPAKGTKA
ncbi:hypothetical protein PSA7680_02374 [Pseudoruegeria aquimaris]|uniref:Uncharacterized protein n=1 Tax=Pseudoruegeria aquimaris TaxID=393663 RepID=A0A1Y5SRU5_9RHOB|nr:hypothetical protein [Pseudoruegeria aquimaris]SLN46322.1 hypothetical protein PSA7680_02374 [Pseudoruegeria aquimaris]